MKLQSSLRRHPYQILTALFLAWKAFLLLLAFLSPGVGYDTSTSLLNRESLSAGLEAIPTTFNSQALKLVRWDAIYFTHISTKGHVFEQEWAFGVGLSGTVSFFLSLFSNTASDHILASTIIGITISHIAHWLSILIIFDLINTIYANNPQRLVTLPTSAAMLHIISPAGLFLSAPYTESLFSFLNMFGSLMYVKGIREYSKTKHVPGNLYTILSGLAFGGATLVRSNGILSGIPFLYDAILLGLSVLRNGPSALPMSKLGCIVSGGVLIAAGFLLPQYVAYSAYCVHDSSKSLRPWCEATIPSIFTFVQSHYWNVGLFRYWTVSNIPLFILALPALMLLSFSAIVEFVGSRLPEAVGTQKISSNLSKSLERECLFRLAMPQALLAILALTSYHVQIITRLSSGYPLWYIWLARNLLSSPAANDKRSVFTSEAPIRWMVIYGVVQAGLFASFLPPA